MIASAFTAAAISISVINVTRVITFGAVYGIDKEGLAQSLHKGKV